MRADFRHYLGAIAACLSLALPMHVCAQETPFAAEAQTGKNAAYVNNGKAYYFGMSGPPKDYAKAAAWFEKAANLGNASGAEWLGRMYVRGRPGVPQDYAKALFWLKKADELGDPGSAHTVAWMYAYGKGVSQDSALAASWYRKAAANGAPDAAEAAKWEAMTPEGLVKEQKVDALESALNVLFVDPTWGVDYGPEDQKKAFAVVEALAAEGLDKAQYYAGYLLAVSDFGSTSWLTHHQDKASQFFLAAARQGYPLAMVEVATRYENGTGLAQDNAKALEWYRKVAALSDEVGKRHAVSARCKVDYLDDGKFADKTCEDWFVTSQRWDSYTLPR